MAQFSRSPMLSPRYNLALQKAFEWHCLSEKGFQMRKDGSPYLAHPIAVSSLVLENGGTENAGIIGLLHDVVEDIGVSEELITFHFGSFVSDGVMQLSEPKQGEWEKRKLAYIEQVRQASDMVVLVSLADKYHNATSYLRGARMKSQDGSQSKTDQTLWFYEELMHVYRLRLPQCYLVDALGRCFEELTMRWEQQERDVLLVGASFINKLEQESESRFEE